MFLSIKGNTIHHEGNTFRFRLTRNRQCWKDATRQQSKSDQPIHAIECAKSNPAWYFIYSTNWCKYQSCQQLTGISNLLPITKDVLTVCWFSWRMCNVCTSDSSKRMSPFRNPYLKIQTKHEWKTMKEYVCSSIELLNVLSIQLYYSNVWSLFICSADYSVILLYGIFVAVTTLVDWECNEIHF